MTYEQAKDALIVHFESQWFTLNPTIPVQFPNAAIVDSAGARVTIDYEQDSWVRLRILPSSGRVLTVAGKVREQVARIMVNVFSPIGVGDGASDALVRSAEGLWDSAHTDGLSGEIKLDAPVPVIELEDPDVPQWRAGVSIPFTIYHKP